MEKTRNARILGVIDFMQSDNAPKLDMEVFYDGADDGEDDCLTSINKRIDGNHWCGTTACIAGYAYILAVRDGFVVEETEDFEYVACWYLGIDEVDGSSLFFNLSICSTEDAVAELQALLE